jgi:hypothetical protein
MDGLMGLLSGVNVAANALFGVVFAPVANLPGWLSLTIISAVLGAVIFVIFTLTANRRAFARIIDDIKANILAVFLFKDSISVTMRCEARLLGCSGRLLWYSLFPVLVMSVPLILVLSQMAMWYQNRPAITGADRVQVQLTLSGRPEAWPDIVLEDHPAVQVLAGPVRLFSRGEVYWEVTPLADGDHDLVFRVAGAQYRKRFSAGEGFMRLSPKRPAAQIFDVLLYPLERPFPSGSLVSAISISYPDRDSKIYGTNWWVLYFCVASMIFALLSKPFIKIRT